MWQADAVVFGGGSLFTDLESVLACVLWGKHAIIARLLGKPLVFAFQGVGPFRTRLGEGMTRAIFRQAAFISVRDEASAARVASWSLGTHVVQTFDPIFLSFCREKVHRSIKKVFIVIPRHNSDAMFMELYKKIISEHTFDEVIILSLQPQDPLEQATIARLRSTTSFPVMVIPVADQVTLLREVASAQEILCQRFHGALAALAQGKTVHICPLGPGDKLAALAEAMRASGGTEAVARHWRDEAETGEAALGQCLHRLESGK